jgi:outer membrane receptor protein involved in Fe transport
VWRFVESQYLRLSFGRAFRKPSLYNSHAHFTGVVGEPAFPELGDFFLDNIGNKDLDNESITAFEIGYRGRFLDGRLNAEADLFFNLYRGTISFVTELATNNLGMPDLNRSRIGYRNAGREVNALGGSISLVYRIKQSLLLGANYTYRHSWYVTEPGESAMEEGGKGDRVPWEPAHLANLTFHYLATAGLRVGAGAHFASSTDNVMPEHGGFFDGPVAIYAPPLLFISGFAAWRIPVKPGWIEMGIRAYNLTGVGFRDSPAAMRPDGVEVGGELLGRRLFLYLRGSI